MVGGTRVAVIMGSFELTWSTSCLCFWEPVRTCDMLTLLHLVRIYSPTVSTLLLSVISFANIISNQGAVILHPKLLLCPRTSECFPPLPSFPPVGSLHLQWPSFFLFLFFFIFTSISCKQHVTSSIPLGSQKSSFASKFPLLSFLLWVGFTSKLYLLSFLLMDWIHSNFINRT